MSEEVRFTQSLVNDAFKVIKSPKKFYQEMRKEGGFGQPLLFLASMTFIGFLVLLVSKALVIRPTGVSGGIILLIVIPTLITLTSFLPAALLYVIWKVLGSQESYETAYRSMAYTCAILPVTSLLILIPVAGAIVSTLWIWYLVVIASIHVHKIKPPLAWLVWGLVSVLFIGVMLSYSLGSRYGYRKYSSEAQKLEKVMDKTNETKEEMK